MEKANVGEKNSRVTASTPRNLSHASFKEDGLLNLLGESFKNSAKMYLDLELFRLKSLRLKSLYPSVSQSVSPPKCFKCRSGGDDDTGGDHDDDDDAILYYTVLDYTILYFTILYYTILYYTIYHIL